MKSITKVFIDDNDIIFIPHTTVITNKRGIDYCKIKNEKGECICLYNGKDFMLLDDTYTLDIRISFDDMHDELLLRVTSLLTAKNKDYNITKILYHIIKVDTSNKQLIELIEYNVNLRLTFDDKSLLTYIRLNGNSNHIIPIVDPKFNVWIQHDIAKEFSPNLQELLLSSDQH